MKFLPGASFTFRESLEEIKYVDFDVFSWWIFKKRKYVLYRESFPCAFHGLPRSCNPWRKNPRKSWWILSNGCSRKLFPQKSGVLFQVVRRIVLEDVELMELFNILCPKQTNYFFNFRHDCFRRYGCGRHWDPDFHGSEKFHRHCSCTTLACKCSYFDQITLTTELITLHCGYNISFLLLRCIKSWDLVIFPSVEGRDRKKIKYETPIF